MGPSIRADSHTSTPLQEPQPSPRTFATYSTTSAMQRQPQQPLRPMPLQGSSDIQQLLDLARAGALNRSAFTTVGGTPSFLPEFSIYSTAQLSGLLGGNGNLQLDQLSQLQQLQNLQNQATLALAPGQQAQPENSGLSRNSQGKSSSRGDKSSTAYASRHQAAEARRRTRINDRCVRTSF